MDADNDAVLKLDLELLDRHNLSRQGWRCFEKTFHIIEYDAGLIDRGGKNEDYAALARREPMLLE